MNEPIATGPDDYTCFDLWAPVYDAQPNPLLALEERVMTPLLPESLGSVLDVGCGTGRWLKKLELHNPRSLVGFDFSKQMLLRARSKLAQTTILHHSNGFSFPCEDNSQTLLLASFVVSYLTDLDRFACECKRVMHTDASLFISDMHPDTSRRKHLKRGFEVSGRHVNIPANHTSIQVITSMFMEHGFKVDALLEPSFATPEEAIFRHAGRPEHYLALINMPAIYILKLRKPAHPRMKGLPSSSGQTLRLQNAPIATGPRTWREGTLDILGTRVQSTRQRSDDAIVTVDLTGYSILPGFTNAHDHLEFGLFPRLGRDSRQEPYRNAAEWAREIQTIHQSTIELHRRVPLSTRLWWAALRNVLCGVTTVCHHNQAYPEFDDPKFPVHVPREIAWAHSLSFDSFLQHKYRDTPADMPFVIHAAEGTDQESRDELRLLQGMQLLQANTVLVHGLALTQTDIASLNEIGSSLIICPTSNLFLFHEASSKELLSSVHRLALGSDSSLTADGDLLDEVKCLGSKIGIDGDEIYNLIVSSATSILNLPAHTGRIVEDRDADLVVVRSKAPTPAATLSAINFEHVELVVRGGTVQAASASLYERLPRQFQQDMQCLEIDGHRRWLRAPLDKLFSASEAVLGKGNLRLGGKSLRYVHPV